ncbi:uncharacterized protein CEXT_702901 [Caerostris extrusa]|uniref:Ig-like domain-containing protein n=1 Tax=Caerostris extrusa TaxID=172846 RepID=A0AAV4WCG8_CAEEX|nr:uncharacterized protein CEXT_702901 [Caerostris extrusa]
MSKFHFHTPIWPNGRVSRTPYHRSEKIETVIAVEGGKTELQCDITPPPGGDEVALVLWYKDEHDAPLQPGQPAAGGCTRRSTPRARRSLGRAFLDMTARPTLLRLDRLKAEDEGIPPKKPVIKDNDGEVLQRVSPAHNLGSRQAFSYCELVEGFGVARRHVPGVSACGAQRAGSGPAGSGRLAQQLRLSCLQQQHLSASDHIGHGRHESQHWILKLEDTSDRDVSVAVRQFISSRCSICQDGQAP